MSLKMIFAVVYSDTVGAEFMPFVYCTIDILSFGKNVS